MLIQIQHHEHFFFLRMSVLFFLNLILHVTNRLSHVFAYSYKAMKGVYPQYSLNDYNYILFERIKIGIRKTYDNLL